MCHTLDAKWTHLDLVGELCVRVLLKEQLVGGHVQNGDDFLRIVHQLAIELSAELPNVHAVHGQERSFQHVNLVITQTGEEVEEKRSNL